MTATRRIQVNVANVQGSIRMRRKLDFSDSGTVAIAGPHPEYFTDKLWGMTPNEA